VNWIELAAIRFSSCIMPICRLNFKLYLKQTYLEQLNATCLRIILHQAVGYLVNQFRAWSSVLTAT